MNQKSLTVKSLIAVAAAVTTNTNHTAVDLAGYADAGRREMKAFGGVVMTANTTSVALKIQANPTTSGSGDSGWADITGATFTAATTSGDIAAIHFRTNARYVRAVSTCAGTTPSFQPALYLLVENRVS